MAKFFTYEERLMLQRLLKEGMSFKKIAAQMYKDPATISREVRKYAVEIATGKPGYSFNACEKTAREPEATTTAAYAAAMSIVRTSLKRFAQSESMFLMSAMPVRRLISVLCSRLSTTLRRLI